MATEPTKSWQQQTKPIIMGILNITPDSFSDGGLYHETERAWLRLKTLLHEGVDLIDIGAESTRPGAELIEVEEEWNRLRGILQLIAEEKQEMPLSLDTRRAEIVRRALSLGVNVSLINDVSALSDPHMFELLAEHEQLEICINHHRGIPAAPQADSLLPPELSAELEGFFRERLASLLKWGVSPTRVWLDPGFGFGKKGLKNIHLLGTLTKIAAEFPCGILIGVSRKRFVRELWGEDRLEAGSLAVATLAVQSGASMIRCHEPSYYMPLKEVFRQLHR